VFHCVANELGISPLNEAMAHHVLWSALSGEPWNERFSLLPDREERWPAAAERPSVVAPGFQLDRDYHWDALVAASGPACRDWAEAYWRESRKILPLVQSGVTRLREQRIDQGRELLEQARAQRDTLQETNRSVFLVLGRFLHAGFAYYHYCVEEYDRAEELIEKSSDCVRAAVEADSGLLPFAFVLLDMPLKLAQIARARHRWKEMREHVAVARALVEDELPLCRDGGGERIYHATIGERLRAFLGPEDGHGLALRYLTDRDTRTQILDQLVARLYALPGFLIPYP
jgi:hypothetical protein